ATLPTHSPRYHYKTEITQQNWTSKLTGSGHTPTGRRSKRTSNDRHIGAPDHHRPRTGPQGDTTHCAVHSCGARERPYGGMPRLIQHLGLRFQGESHSREPGTTPPRSGMERSSKSTRRP